MTTTTSENTKNQILLAWPTTACISTKRIINALIAKTYVNLLITLDDADDHAISKLGDEPCALWRHHLALVGNSEELLHSDWWNSNGERVVGSCCLLESLKAASSTDEGDAWVSAELLDVEDRCEEEVCEDLAVDVVGGRLGDGLALEVHLVPLAADVEGEVALAVWTSEVLREEGWSVVLLITLELLDGEVVLLDLGEELLVVELVLLDDAVVVDDAELGVSEDAGHEVAERLGASVLVASGLLALVPDVEGGGGTVVAVSDVDVWDLSEEFGDLVDALLIIDDPKLVIGVVEVEVGNAIWFASSKAPNVLTELVELLTVVSKEDRANVSILDVNSLGAVDFWSVASLLVLLDEALSILLAGEEGVETNLGVIAKLSAVSVVGWLVRADKKVISNPLLEELSALFVDAVICSVNTWEGNFWTIDMDQAFFALFAHLGSLLTGDNIVWWGDNISHLFLRRNIATEWFNNDARHILK